MSIRTFAETWATLRVPSPDGGLTGLTPHREQRRVMAAVDSPVTREILLSWPRKTGKTATLAAIGLHHLTVPVVHGPRLVGMVASDADQSDIVFRQMRDFVLRRPGLAGRVKIYKTEMVFAVTMTEPRTGGRYVVEHRAMALANDTKGLHGLGYSCIIADEFWALGYDLLEALVIDPTRYGPGTLTVYASYQLPPVMQRPGVPLFDLIRRVEAGGDSSLVYSYIGGRVGPNSAPVVVPWISEAWIAEQERRFAAAPSKFVRMILNQPAPPDGDALIVGEELRAALDPHVPETPIPGSTYTIGVDLGITRDHTAIVVVRLDAQARVEVTTTRLYKGTRALPVDLSAVERALLDLAQRYRPQSVRIDAWQAIALVQRLQARGVPAKAVTVEQTKLNRIITLLKHAFAGRHIRVRPSEADLVAQLDGLRTMEGRSARRDLVTFVPSGTGPSVGEHDDLAVALGLALDALGPARIGRLQLAEQPHGCDVVRNGRHVECVLWAPMRGQIKPDPGLCKHCPGWHSAEAMYRAHVDTGGTLDLRTFLAECVSPNSTARQHQMTTLSAWL